MPLRISAHELTALDSPEAAGLSFIHCLHDSENVRFDDWPADRRQRNDRNAPARQVLLMRHREVARDENVETVRLRCLKQLPVLQTSPAEIRNGVRVVMRQVLP